MRRRSVRSLMRARGLCAERGPHGPRHLPRARSLARAVVDFFGRNPGEELTYADVNLKFGTPATTSTLVSDALLPWIERGLLARRLVGRGPARTAIVSAGPRLALILSTTAEEAPAP